MRPLGCLDDFLLGKSSHHRQLLLPRCHLVRGDCHVSLSSLFLLSVVVRFFSHGHELLWVANQ